MKYWMSKVKKVSLHAVQICNEAVNKKCLRHMLHTYDFFLYHSLQMSFDI